MIKTEMPRTDLALEVRETFAEDDLEIRGVSLKEDYNKTTDICVTTVIIKDEKGANAMKKPIGTYITIEATRLNENDESYQEPVSEEIAKNLKKLMGKKKQDKILVAGLGNREITPDALGPEVIDNLFVTRHFLKEYGEDFLKQNNLPSFSAISRALCSKTI